MNDSCCCYVVDAGYLFPTVLSALQARAETSVSETDIKIFCVGNPDRGSPLFAEVCRSNGIDLVPVASGVLDNMPIMFARFFLWRMLETKYEAVIYLDGDTQISGSLRPLLQARLASGTFLAARDPMSLLIRERSRLGDARRNYLHSIGLSEEASLRYCNSGVLRFNLQDWQSISREILNVSARHNHQLKFPDQDALNIAFGTSYQLMSYKWNFPSFLMATEFQTLILPNVYHFMSNPRPWQGAFFPWGKKWHSPYQKLADRFPQLKSFDGRLGYAQYFRYVVQQRLKQLAEGRLWNSDEIKAHLLSSEAEAYV